MTRSRFNRAGVAGALLACAGVTAGCTEEPPAVLPAGGVVKLNGEPLPKALVRFVPLGEIGPNFIASAVTDEQGRYTLVCDGRPGACAGENRVVVSESDPPNELLAETAQAELAEYLAGLKNRPIPRAYADLAGSPLKVTVEEGKAEYDLELSGK